MARIGDIRRSWLTGRKQILVACIDCGIPRWTNLVKGCPRYLLCRSCAGWARAWKGGIIKDSKGYVRVFNPEHPFADKSGYVKRATLVLEEKLGRFLGEGMLAHHKNEIKEDDSPENLEEFAHGKHTKLHWRLRRLIKAKGG